MITIDDSKNSDNNNNKIIEGIYTCRCISQSITRHFIKWKKLHLLLASNNDYITIIGNSTYNSYYLLLFHY